MSIEKILIVDDEMLIRNFLAETLQRKKYDVTTADCGTKAIQILKEQSFDLVFTDMNMPDMTGMDVLKKVKELSKATLVVVITAFGSIENAVEAMRLGAYNYLIKPFTPDTIEAVIEKAQEHLALVEENQYLRHQVSHQNARSSGEVVCESQAMKQVLGNVVQVAKSSASVFINGESGTGKEVIAHAVHTNSPRQGRAFIRVNCAAVPDTLVESEFFGHEKGSFTGANTKRIGRFELAHGGSLLLDEITEIPINLQPKLLRVIQEKEFERVGGSKLINVDVRLISTSNRSMEEAIEEKVFREDLYYRLNVVPIYLPPLRERRDDILPLARHFVEKMCIENHQARKEISKEAEAKLLAYHWPGNIRELANIIERAIVLNQGNIVLPDHLYLNANELDVKQVLEKIEESQKVPEEGMPIGITLHEMEKRLIIETLQREHNNRTKTAQILGISIRTLRNKLNEYAVPKGNQKTLA